jgi:hypothetical protein
MVAPPRQASPREVVRGREPILRGASAMLGRARRLGEAECVDGCVERIEVSPGGVATVLPEARRKQSLSRLRGLAGPVEAGAGGDRRRCHPPPMGRVGT